MAFRFLILVTICGYVSAVDYDYNNPGNNQQSFQSNQEENIASAAVVNSYTIDDNPQNAQQTPDGYDYRPKQPAYAVYYTPAKYQFTYGVHDELTGDIKSHTESREGDLVRGTYSLIDADGYKRTVVYTADDANGFNAVVKREPIAVTPARIQLQPLQAPFVNMVHYQPKQYQQPQQQQQQHQIHMVEVEVQNYPQYVQPRDSYAVPPVQTANGPYP